MLDRRRELAAQLAAIDPDKKAKLEKALEMAKNIRPLRDWADDYGQRLELKTGGPLRSFTPLGDTPMAIQHVKTIAEMPTAWLANGMMPVSDDWNYAELFDELFDRLQLEVIAFPDRMDVRGLVPFNLPDAPLHASQHGRGLG